MAKDIKTRQIQKDIKVLDKAAIGITHVKRASVKTKEAIDEAQMQEDGTVQEYASDKMTHAAEKAAREAAYQAGRQAKKIKQVIKEKKKTSKDSISEQSSFLTKEQIIKRKSQDKEKQKILKERERRSIRVLDNTEKKQIKLKNDYSIKTDDNKAIKTAEQTNRIAIKTVNNTFAKIEHAKKLSVITAERAKNAVKQTAKSIEKIIKKVAIAIVSSVKAIVASGKSLMLALGAGGGNSTTVLPVSEEVEAYEPLIRQYATQYGISEYVELIKAVMMQESGGRGLDPMQSSEGGFNARYPRQPNGITDPEYSISCGVQELKSCIEAAEVESPIDMDNIKLCLQGYNFGNGYISWARTNYGGYTAMNAAEFSDMMAARLGWSSYGDKQYVAHVLRYYPFGRVPNGIGNQAIVQIALSQEGNVGGQPYWSWYGFDSRVEWCACFVSWCAEQCGYIDAGIIPKFALCSNGASWFARNGQFQDGSYVPASGDIIFFDWGANGDVDHVGIVESVENGVVYTIEGNSGDMCKRNSYPIGYYEIYGYGVPVY